MITPPAGVTPTSVTNIVTNIALGGDPRLTAAGGASAETGAGGLSGTDFANALKDALVDVNEVHAAADQKMQAFVTGADVPVHEVMMAVAQAETTVRLATVVATRAISAYEEISRIQV